MLVSPDCYVTDEDVAAQVRVEPPCPDIVVGAGPCRSGTSFYLQVFAHSGFQVWRQPLKTILRGSLHDSDTRFVVNGTAPVFVKETLGPYVCDEALFNPVKILLTAGVPAEKIHFLVLARDPFATATSWIEQFSHAESRDNLVDTCLLSYESINATRQYATSLGIRTTTLVYDVWRSNDPAIVVQRLLARLGYPYSPFAISGWEPLPELEAQGKTIFSLSQPDVYNHHLASYYDKVNHSTGITYFDKPIDVIRNSLSQAHLMQIAQSRALEIYKDFVRSTERDLDMDIESKSTVPLES